MLRKTGKNRKHVHETSNPSNIRMYTPFGFDEESFETKIPSSSAHIHTRGFVSYSITHTISKADFGFDLNTYERFIQCITYSERIWTFRYERNTLYEDVKIVHENRT